MLLKAQRLGISFSWKISWFGFLAFCCCNRLSSNGVWIFIAFPVIYTPQKYQFMFQQVIGHLTLTLAFNEALCWALWSGAWIFPICVLLSSQLSHVVRKVSSPHHGCIGCEVGWIKLRVRTAPALAGEDTPHSKRNRLRCVSVPN